MNQEALRKVPQLEKLLKAIGEIPGIPRLMFVQQVRNFQERVRAEAKAGQIPADFPDLVQQATAELGSLALSRLQPVINGTGVLIHTNLGRSPLAQSIAAQLADFASSYTNLELDLESGERGKRGRFAEQALALLCGAEAATVTNNCAASLVLILRTLAAEEKREVIISRGQLVEIGGGFRVPEIMETSGAILKEVGATNKVTIADYAKAIGPRTSMLLRVHRSNFYMGGFVEEPDTTALKALAEANGLPMVEDLGSGAMVATEHFPGLEHEPTPAECITAGADLVCFSGDKLFGGPQAGIIVGKASLIAKLKRDPFFRALRCDKLILNVLQETTAAYLHQMTEGRQPEDTPLPLLDMLHQPLEQLQSRAEDLVAELSQSQLPASFVTEPSTSRPGGGTMPKSEIPSRRLCIQPHHIPVGELGKRLRVNAAPLPVVGYIEANRLCIDLRTVFPTQDVALFAAITNALSL
jgi:L-seryl-tRNA(Ser) seleniumtransferase